eukprot:765392-Hanusia_phi.AAC.2
MNTLTRVGEACKARTGQASVLAETSLCGKEIRVHDHARPLRRQVGERRSIDRAACERPRH